MRLRRIAVDTSPAGVLKHSRGERFFQSNRRPMRESLANGRREAGRAHSISLFFFARLARQRPSSEKLVDSINQTRAKEGGGRPHLARRGPVWWSSRPIHDDRDASERRHLTPAYDWRLSLSRSGRAHDGHNQADHLARVGRCSFRVLVASTRSK